MRKLRQIAVALAALLAVVLCAAPAMAADTYTITVKNDSTHTTMEGQEFLAYKVFDVTYDDTDGDDVNDAFAYTVDEDFANFTYDGKTGADLVAYVSGLQSDSSELNDFAEAVRAYVNNADNHVTADGRATGTADSQQVTITVDEPGYYLVLGSAATDGQTEGEVVAFAALSTTQPSAEVDVKADIPTVAKEVNAESDASGAWGAWADYEIGDTVPFRITGTIPAYAEDYDSYTYVIHDVMSEGLTLDASSVKVYTDATLKTELAAGSYTVATSGLGDGCSFHVTISPDYIKGNHASTIYVGYTATVNDQVAVFDDVNTNKTHIEFSNDPYDTTSKDTTPDKQVKVYTYSFQLFKYVAADGGAREAVPGAGFKLYRDAQRADEIKVVQVSVGDAGTAAVYRLAEAGEDGVEMIVPESGLVTIQGLDAGTYYLYETTVPEGYHALNESVAVTVTPTADDTNTGVASVAVTASGANSDVQSNVVNIPNATGSLLPTTGGIGTTLFYVAGAVLVVAAGAGIVLRRRAGER